MKPAGPSPTTSTLYPVAAFGNGPLDIQRIPSCQQAIDLKAPRQFQNILQRARFGLRDVDGILLLVNAGLHAVVADAMAGTGAHRIVDVDDRKRADRIAFLLGDVHLGDLLVERAAVQRDAEDALLELAGLLAQAGGARVLPLVVALDAIGRLIDRAREIGAGIGQTEAFALAPVRRMQLKRRRAFEWNGLDVDQMQGIQFCGSLNRASWWCFSRPAGERAAHAAYCAAICRCSRARFSHRATGTRGRRSCFRSAARRTMSQAYGRARDHRSLRPFPASCRSRLS